MFQNLTESAICVGTTHVHEAPVSEKKVINDIVGKQKSQCLRSQPRIWSKKQKQSIPIERRGKHKKYTEKQAQESFLWQRWNMSNQWQTGLLRLVIAEL